MRANIYAPNSLNHFSVQWDEKEKMSGRFELQTQLPKLRRERPELNRVYSKVLHMALYHLCSNLVEVEESWKQLRG